MNLDANQTKYIKAVDKGSEFYDRSVKPWFQDNNVEMYSTHNEGKSVLAGRFIRTLRKKSFKNTTSVLKNMYINILDEIVNKYKNTYDITIKMKPVDVILTHILILIKNAKEDPEFELDNHVRILNINNYLAKGYTPNRSEEAFVIKKVKNTIIMTKKFFERFMKNNC